jgi:hypothetical protein
LSILYNVSGKVGMGTDVTAAGMDWIAGGYVVGGVSRIDVVVNTGAIGMLGGTYFSCLK